LSEEGLSIFLNDRTSPCLFTCAIRKYLSSGLKGKKSTILFKQAQNCLVASSNGKTNWVNMICLLKTKCKCLKRVLDLKVKETTQKTTSQIIDGRRQQELTLIDLR